MVVVDYESGNLRSVSRALETCGVSPLVSGDPADLRDADAVVLPGVGAGPAAMSALNQRGLSGPLREFAESGRPFFGICLGLQLLLDWTDEEPGAPCLGIVPGSVRRLPDRENDDHPALHGIDPGSYFYFVHSFYAEPTRPEGVLGTTEYGLHFCSVYAKDNVVATQFHPEKSGPVGLRIYHNFVAMAARGARAS
ncbi:Imidazole glycerol phosphate synthase subunit HisH [Geodia barretti]|uniref:Imidazole glycerol phosphate synthase subunit HisH n=1 Tax=Geodia barretti TaxID=519541 RepID=A0AA35RQ89_GEOBA|nr:Imidazole glycerol phosphate synthase subunit HisH [Geodia barretti]